MFQSIPGHAQNIVMIYSATYVKHSRTYNSTATSVTSLFLNEIGMPYYSLVGVVPLSMTLRDLFTAGGLANKGSDLPVRKGLKLQ